MKLIIDCGSTKADWAIINESGVVKIFNTEGFNPNYTDKETITRIISEDISYKDFVENISKVFFYGSGCGNDKNCKLIKEIISSVFVNAEINVIDDMMGTCYALLGNQQGVACILGTGSNSCFYNGNEIVDRAVSLGFILGDEGSGSHLGKTLLHEYFYNKIPEVLSMKFEKEYDINIKSMIDNVYHKDGVSRYFASFAKFLYDNKEHEFVIDLCSKCFDEFIENFVMRYGALNTFEVAFVGSIAYYFQDIIKQRLEVKGLKLGKIMKSPIEGLIAFHSS